jgi:predicted transcriptional regulator
LPRANCAQRGSRAGCAATPEAPLLAYVLVPLDPYFDLPDDRCRSLLVCLLAHTDKNGVCFPNMRQMAEIVGCSPATVCRRLRVMEERGVFQRERLRAGGRYRYTIAEPYRRAPKLLSAAAEAAVALVKRCVSEGQPGVSGAATQEAKLPKQRYKKEDARTHASAATAPSPATRVPLDSPTFKWRARLRQLREQRLWAAHYGPLPGEPGCQAPPELVIEFFGQPSGIRERLLSGTALAG